MNTAPSSKRLVIGTVKCSAFREGATSSDQERAWMAGTGSLVVMKFSVSLGYSHSDSSSWSSSADKRS